MGKLGSTAWRLSREILVLGWWAGIVTLLAHPVISVTAQETDPLAAATITTINTQDRPQIAIERDGQLQVLRPSNYTQKLPQRAGEYVVWLEEQQAYQVVVRYHLPSQAVLELTPASLSQLPQVNARGQVVWQEWDGEDWAVKWFDGETIARISVTGVAYQPVWYDEDIYLSVRTVSASDWELYAFNTLSRSLRRVNPLQAPAIDTKASILAQSMPAPALALPEILPVNTNSYIDPSSISPYEPDDSVDPASELPAELPAEPEPTATPVESSPLPSPSSSPSVTATPSPDEQPSPEPAANPSASEAAELSGE